MILMLSLAIVASPADYLKTPMTPVTVPTTKLRVASFAEAPVVRIQLERAAGIHGPVVNSCLSTSSASWPCLAA
ncbi:hypothetical protein, partial [Micromonospora sp. ATA51]|uniref:hypothetical protein n=1 Tax=Micromonospora sp. ATA51 TaxID=2806098 RepID=UPI001EE40B63